MHQRQYTRGARTAAMVLLLVLATAATAHAQSRGGGRRGGGSSTPSQSTQPAATPAPSTPAREYGPQLEGGALLCSSKDELIKYQAGATAPGAAADGPPPDCRPILNTTEIQIISRDGPSRTEVVALSDSKLTGWTNTYFPPR